MRFCDPSARVATMVADFARPSSRPTTSITSVPSSPCVCAFSPSRNCSGSTPMPTRLARWMRSKLSATTARMPSRLVPLAAQSREEPVPYSLPANTTVGTPAARYCIAAS